MIEIKLDVASTVTALAALVAAVTSALAYWRTVKNGKEIEVVKHATNSLTDKAQAMALKLGLAEGNIAGRTAQKAESAAVHREPTTLRELPQAETTRAQGEAKVAAAVRAAGVMEHVAVTVEETKQAVEEVAADVKDVKEATAHNGTIESTIPNRPVR